MKRSHLRDLTVLYNNNPKADDIFNFNQNFHLSTDQNTSFCDKKIGRDIIQKEKMQYDQKNEEVIKYAEKAYRQVNKDFKYYFRFGQQLRKSKLKRQEYDDDQNKTMFQKTSQSFEGMKPSKRRRAFYRQKIYDFQRLSLKLKQQQQMIIDSSNKIESLTLRKIKQIEQQSLDDFRQLDNCLNLKQDFYSENILNQGKAIYQHHQFSQHFQMFSIESGIKAGELSEIINVDFLKFRTKGFLQFDSAIDLQYIPYGYQSEQITMKHLFGCSCQYFDSQILKQQIRINDRRNKYIKRIQQQNQLQVQINEITKEIKNLKDKRKLNKNKEMKSMQIQTERLITNDILKDLIFFDAQKSIKTIQNYSQIKQKQKIYNQKQYPQVFSIANKYIQQNLVNLLFSIIQNETFVSISDFICDTLDQYLEQKLIKIISQNLEQIQGKVNRNGVSKIKILRFYTQHKILLKKQKSLRKNKNIHGKNKQFQNNKVKDVSKNTPQKSFISNNYQKKREKNLPISRFALDKSNISRRSSLSQSSIKPVRKQKLGQRPLHLRSVAQQQVSFRQRSSKVRSKSRKGNNKSIVR